MIQNNKSVIKKFTNRSSELSNLKSSRTGVLLTSLTNGYVERSTNEGVVLEKSAQRPSGALISRKSSKLELLTEKSSSELLKRISFFLN